MRALVGTTFAAALLAGGAILTAAPVLAGFDEAGENSFWTHQSVSNAPVGEARGSAQRNSQYRATYGQPAAEAPAAAAQKDPQYFYHAMGTMSTQ